MPIPGGHDGSACLFDEYRLIAAIPLERMTRIKDHGGGVPIEAIDECLTIAGCRLADVDAIVLTRGLFPSR